MYSIRFQGIQRYDNRLRTNGKCRSFEPPISKHAIAKYDILATNTRRIAFNNEPYYRNQ